MASGKSCDFNCHFEEIAGLTLLHVIDNAFDGNWECGLGGKDSHRANRV